MLTKLSNIYFRNSFRKHKILLQINNIKYIKIDVVNMKGIWVKKCKFFKIPCLWNVYYVPKSILGQCKEISKQDIHLSLWNENLFL